MYEMKAAIALRIVYPNRYTAGGHFVKSRVYRWDLKVLENIIESRADHGEWGFEAGVQDFGWRPSYQHP